MGRIYNVLFLCAENSAESILAESILNERGRGRFRAHSAGRQPCGAVHPEALRLLCRLELPVEGLRSKRWDEFVTPGAPALDFVFTVGEAANETWPSWPGQPVPAHWELPGSTAFEGSRLQLAQAFAEVVRVLRLRISLLTALSDSSLDHMVRVNRVPRERTSPGYTEEFTRLLSRPGVRNLAGYRLAPGHNGEEQESADVGRLTGLVQ